MTASAKGPEAEALSDEEQQLLEEFLEDNQLFLGPDPKIMRDHKPAPRTEEEDRVLAAGLDPHRLNLVRGRINAALQEGFDMCEQMGTAPGAKWGDLAVAAFTGSGDLSAMGPKGVVVFCGVLHYPIRYILKNWVDDPTVGVRDGDGFIHNDSRFGNIHNTDQSMIVPIFHDGELICWVSSTIHEGENGATEPGGLPPSAETVFDEGLKMCPFKVVENFRIRRDLQTFLQNSVRDPKLQLEDMRVKLHSCLRVRTRMLAIIDEFGRDYVVACLRKNIEDVAEEVRRRIRELPDGTVRQVGFIDGTLRENVLIKFNLAITVKGDRMTIDVRGSSPEFTNRSINTTIASFKTCLMTAYLTFIWPDLPHNMAIFEPVDLVSDESSLLDCGNWAPNSLSLIPLFRAFTIPITSMQKFLYSLPERVTKVISAHYSQPATFIYGGLTQHGEITGNFCADINGNGQGARSDADGEHALSPVFGFMCDTGEQEIQEEELPIVRLVAQQITKDRMGFGKYRGGAGYEQIVTARGSQMWGFMTGCTGSHHSATTGLFGGYGCPAYPLMKVRNTNVFEHFKDRPKDFKFSMLELWNEQPIPGDYGTYDLGMTLEMVNEGEVYAICQGAGGGYGDVLDRDPALVMQDLEEDLISHETAKILYFVVYDEETLVVDEAATADARAKERKARIARGKPFDAFVDEWVTEAPPAELPYYGSWGDPGTIYAGTGEARKVMAAETLEGTFMPHPKDVEIARLKAELAEAKGKGA